MNLANITAESLSAELETPVPDIYVILAKHSVSGLDSDSIADVLGVPVGEVTEIESDETYRAVRTYVGALYAQSQSSRIFGWDGIEGMAIEKLAERLPYEKDSDFLLKVAAVANKAQRRQSHETGVLDPSKAGAKVVRVTQRMVSRMQNGRSETVETRELSIHDGSMGSVSFDEVNQTLEVTDTPAIPQSMQIATRDAVPSDDILQRELEKRI